MKRFLVARITDGELFDLVRSADPIGTSSFAQASEESSAMLERTITTARQIVLPPNKHRLTGRRHLLLATTLIVVIAAGIGGALAGGLLSEGSAKVADIANSATSGRLVNRAAEKAAASEKVTNLVVVAAAPSGNAGVVEGVQNGTHVSTVTIGSGTGLFVSTSKALDWAKGLYVETGESGPSPNKVGEFDMAGIATTETASVDLVGQDGTTRSLNLGEMSEGSKAFAVAIDPNDFKPSYVVAYDKEGRELVRKAIPAADFVAPDYKEFGVPKR